MNLIRQMTPPSKAMGLNAVCILFGGCLSVFAIWGGLGLPGVAVAAVAGIVLVNAARLGVARKAIDWIGLSLPIKDELIGFTKLSAAVSFTSLSGLLLNATICW